MRVKKNSWLLIFFFLSGKGNRNVLDDLQDRACVCPAFYFSQMSGAEGLRQESCAFALRNNPRSNRQQEGCIGSLTCGRPEHLCAVWFRDRPHFIASLTCYTLMYWKRWENGLWIWIWKIFLVSEGFPMLCRVPATLREYLPEVLCLKREAQIYLLKLSTRIRRLLCKSHLGRAGSWAVIEVSSRGLALSVCK